MPKGAKAVAKSKAAGAAASSGASRKAAANKDDPFVHHEDITPQEFTAFAKYQSAFYHDINAHLRGGANAHLAQAHAVAEIPHLHSILGKQSLARDTTLYRGFTAHEGFNPSAYKAGDIYEARGFFSTSLNKSVAKGFVDEMDAGSGSVLFHIKAPKGAKALPGYKLGTGSSFQQSEREVLLGHGSRIKVDKVRKDKSGVYHFYGKLQ